MTTGDLIGHGRPALINEALTLQQSQAKVDSVFRELALRDMGRVNDHVAELMASRIQEAKEARPDLTDVEAFQVASRIMKQLILSYKSALDQLL